MKEKEKDDVLGDNEKKESRKSRFSTITKHHYSKAQEAQAQA